ncbi:hypothetical protein I316_03529 [Kwoniella heveanensis BCC8398]|uniref:Uncharacterized protein n=1 Tax=Kwoniella heveanensis BCC8398 TaxID=1296120 RepID=A0A1B9GVD7_9TREE|nr:hypothetical protein I316_03529 [Kwoniella heveanensis BCC8398]
MPASSPLSVSASPSPMTCTTLARSRARPAATSVPSLTDTTALSCSPFQHETETENEKMPGPIPYAVEDLSSPSTSPPNSSSANANFPDTSTMLNTDSPLEKNEISSINTSAGTRTGKKARRHGSITEAWWAFNVLIEVSRLEDKRNPKRTVEGGSTDAGDDHRVRHFLPGLHFRRRDDA